MRVLFLVLNTPAAAFLANSFREYDRHSYMRLISHKLPSVGKVQKIPKIFHNIWLDFGDGCEIFPSYIENTKHLQTLHPDWMVVPWKEPEIIALIKKKCPRFLKTYLSYDSVLAKHYVAKLLILYYFGGVYIDYGFLTLKNLEPLLKSYDFVISNEECDSLLLSTRFIGSIKKHKLLKIALKAQNCKNSSKQSSSELLTCAFLKYVNVSERFGIKVYDSGLFDPMHWNRAKNAIGNNVKGLAKNCPDSFCIQGINPIWE